MNRPALQAQARLRNDIKATKTINITTAAYFFSYVPAVAYVIVGQQKENQADSWFGFFAWYPIFFLSALNLIVYYLRFRRFRSVFKQFLKNPIGTWDNEFVNPTLSSTFLRPWIQRNFRRRKSKPAAKETTALFPLLFCVLEVRKYFPWYGFKQTGHWCLHQINKWRRHARERKRKKKKRKFENGNQ